MMDLDPNELELEPDGNHLIDGQEGSQIRKDIRIQLKPKLTSDKNKRSRLKKTIRIKRNQNHLDSTMSSRKSGNLSETKLQWNYTEKLIGEPSTIPNAHLCPICMKPILIYGRLKPCKHTFCYTCAKDLKECKRCNSSFEKVEECKFGDLFLCAFDSKRYSSEGCFSSYKSLRDLESHVNFRHKMNLNSGYYPAFLKILKNSQTNSEVSLPTDPTELNLSMKNEMSPGSNTPTHDPAPNDTSNSSTPDSKIQTSSQIEPPITGTPPRLPRGLGLSLQESPPQQPSHHTNMFSHQNIPIPALNIHPQSNNDILPLPQFTIPSHTLHHPPRTIHSPMQIPPRLSHNQPPFHNNMGHPLAPTGIGVIPTNMPAFVSTYAPQYNNSSHVLGYKHNPFPSPQGHRPFMPDHIPNMTGNNPIPTHPPMYTGSRPS